MNQPAAAPVGIDVLPLLQALYESRHVDFREYATASLRRRVALAMSVLRCETVSQLRSLLLDDDRACTAVLRILTVPVSEMFRDPSFYRTFREDIIPELSTYPSIKIWIAGCCTGEEVYSFAIVLAEEGLLDRTLVYATDINDDSLAKARQGVFTLDRLAAFSDGYFKAGGKHSLSRYYVTAYGAAVFSRSLVANVVFADHSLATDSVFSEVQVVSCRNVLIYFNRQLQDRALGLFRDALSQRAFLGLGSRETVQFSAYAGDFATLRPGESWYRRC
jgi:chemotaxis protein methyltransferase CheR